MIAIIACLVASVLTGCGPNTGDAKKQKFEVDRNLSGSEPTSDSVQGDVDQTQFESVDSQIAYAQMLDMRSSRGPFGQMVYDQKSRVKIANRLLVQSLNPQQRQQVIQIKMIALLKLHATSDRKAREQLIEFAKQHSTDDDETIRRIARTAVATIELADYLRTEDAEFSVLRDCCQKLLDDYPDSQEVAAELQAIVLRLLVREKRDQSIALMQILRNKYSRSQDPHFQKLADTLDDRILLAELKFDLTLNDMKMGILGSREKFLKLIHQLAQDKSISHEIYKEIVDTARWLEQIDLHDEAKELNQLVRKTLIDSSDKSLSERVANDTEFAIRRLDSIGQQLVIAGQTGDGTGFDRSQVKNKVVALFFWSAKIPQSVRAMQQLIPLYTVYKSRGFEIVGVCIDKDVQQAISIFNGQPPPWTNVYRNSDGSNFKMLQACGIQFVPYVVLIDKKGKVADINVPLVELKDDVDQLLSQQIDSDETLNPVPGGREQDGAGPTNSEQSGQDPNNDGNAHESSTSDDAALSKSAKTDFVLVSTSGPQDERAVGKKAEGQPAINGARDTKAGPVDNPYSPPAHWDSKRLIDFLLTAEEKPRSIRRREAFVAAICQAADRIAADENAKPAWQRIAFLTQCEILHNHACWGNAQSDKKIGQILDSVEQTEDPKIATEVRFLAFERKLIGRENPTPEQIESLLKEAKQFCQSTDLNDRHLRLASNIVRLINLLDADQPDAKAELAKKREGLYGEFGALFVTSADRKLHKYGKQLANSGSSETANIGKQLEIDGQSLDGEQIDDKELKGTIVLMDFWATWCGPCRKEMQAIKELYREFDEDAFEVLGISLDEEIQDVRDYVAENEVAWPQIAGEDARHLVKKYKVRSLPSMMLVDASGKIVATSNRASELKPKIARLISELASKSK